MAQVLVNEDYLDSAGAALQEKLGQKVSPKNFGKEIKQIVKSNLNMGISTAGVIKLTLDLTMEVQ